MKFRGMTGADHGGSAYQLCERHNTVNGTSTRACAAYPRRPGRSGCSRIRQARLCSCVGEHDPRGSRATKGAMYFHFQSKEELRERF